MMNFVLKLVSLLPLSWVHRIGSVSGRIAYRFGERYRRLMHDNLAQAGLEGKVDINEINRHAGMQALEPFWIWKRSDADVMRHVRWDDAECDAVREALAAGCSIVFMTPHVGCYEVTPIWLYDTCLKLFDKKMTVLYREPKVKFIRAAVANGRIREGMDPAPADLAGVRKILRAMRSGGTLGCLPDQVPGRGEGVWVPFFGRKAFTMTFPVKIAKQFDAVRFVAWAVRDPGHGWTCHVRRWDDELTGDLEQDTIAMNRVIEETILQSPEQYIWNYNRFKCPKGVAKPDQETAA